MRNDDYTTPPCQSCSSHDELEDKFVDMQSRNYTEHAQIKTSLSWMHTIGASLVAGIVAIFWLVWGLHDKEDTTGKTLVKVQTEVGYISYAIQANLVEQKETKEDIYDKIDECRDEFHIKENR